MKKWAAGTADEAWKVTVCARDAARADNLIHELVAMLTDAGSDTARGLSTERDMSGAQIVDAVVAFQRSAHQSVQNGLAAGARQAEKPERT